MASPEDEMRDGGGVEDPFAGMDDALGNLDEMGNKHLLDARQRQTEGLLEEVLKNPDVSEMSKIKLTEVAEKVLGQLSKINTRDEKQVEQMLAYLDKLDDNLRKMGAGKKKKEEKEAEEEEKPKEKEEPEEKKLEGKELRGEIVGMVGAEWTKDAFKKYVPLVEEDAVLTPEEKNELRQHIAEMFKEGLNSDGKMRQVTIEAIFGEHYGVYEELLGGGKEEKTEDTSVIEELKRFADEGGNESISSLLVEAKRLLDDPTEIHTIFYGFNELRRRFSNRLAALSLNSDFLPLQQKFKDRFETQFYRMAEDARALTDARGKEIQFYSEVERDFPGKKRLEGILMLLYTGDIALRSKDSGVDVKTVVQKEIERMKEDFIESGFMGEAMQVLLNDSPWVTDSGGEWKDKKDGNRRRRRLWRTDKDGRRLPGDIAEADIKVKADELRDGSESAAIKSEALQRHESFKTLLEKLLTVYDCGGLLLKKTVDKDYGIVYGSAAIEANTAIAGSAAAVYELYSHELVRCNGTKRDYENVFYTDSGWDEADRTDRKKGVGRGVVGKLQFCTAQKMHQPATIYRKTFRTGRPPEIKYRIGANGLVQRTADKKPVYDTVAQRDWMGRSTDYSSVEQFEADSAPEKNGFSFSAAKADDIKNAINYIINGPARRFVFHDGQTDQKIVDPQLDLAFFPEQTHGVFSFITQQIIAFNNLGFFMEDFHQLRSITAPNLPSEAYAGLNGGKDKAAIFKVGEEGYYIDQQRGTGNNVLEAATEIVDVYPDVEQFDQIQEGASLQTHYDRYAEYDDDGNILEEFENSATGREYSIVARRFLTTDDSELTFSAKQRKVILKILDNKKIKDTTDSQREDYPDAVKKVYKPRHWYAAVGGGVPYHWHWGQNRAIVGNDLKTGTEYKKCYDGDTKNIDAAAVSVHAEKTPSVSEYVNRVRSVLSGASLLKAEVGPYKPDGGDPIAIGKYEMLLSEVRKLNREFFPHLIMSKNKLSFVEIFADINELSMEMSYLVSPQGKARSLYNSEQALDMIAREFRNKLSKETPELIAPVMAIFGRDASGNVVDPGFLHTFRSHKISDATATRGMDRYKEERLGFMLDIDERLQQTENIMTSGGSVEPYKVEEHILPSEVDESTFPVPPRESWSDRSEKSRRYQAKLAYIRAFYEGPNSLPNNGFGIGPGQWGSTMVPKK